MQCTHIPTIAKFTCLVKIMNLNCFQGLQCFVKKIYKFFQVEYSELYIVDDYTGRRRKRFIDSSAYVRSIFQKSVRAGK